MCGLSEDEVLAIAEHEHIPEITAAALGHYLEHSEAGPETIRTMIVDDIRAAKAAGDEGHARHLINVLRHYLVTHHMEHKTSVN